MKINYSARGIFRLIALDIKGIDVNNFLSSSWKRCVDQTEEVLGFALGYEYVRKFFHNDARKSVSEALKTPTSTVCPSTRINKVRYFFILFFLG